MSHIHTHGAGSHSLYWGMTAVRQASSHSTEKASHPHSTMPSGQPHDRIRDNDPLSGIPTSPLPDRDEVPDVEISAGQKMLSAMSGSLLTSLIGKYSSVVTGCANNGAVTPLDVVRIRLQSQPQNPLAAIQKLAAANASSISSFQTMPPNLGVTACCREVFFMNNNAEVCMAGPRVGEIGVSAGGDVAGCVVEETQRKTFNSTFDGIRKIARNEGITTLWRGLSPTLVMTIPANIIYFTGYDWLRFSKASPLSSMVSDNYSPLLAGSAARIMAAVVVSPIEMFRTRMQASTATGGAHFAETVAGIKEMVQATGYTSLWRGLTLTLWRDVPFSGLYWWGYEVVKNKLQNLREERGRTSGVDRTAPRSRSVSRDDHTSTFLDSFIAGAASGGVASILTMPFDVGKTRQQIFKDARPAGADNAKRVLAPEELSMPRLLMHIFKEEGFAGLWKGWVARTLKVAPACAIMISSYEVGKRMAVSVNERAVEKASAKYD